MSCSSAAFYRKANHRVAVSQAYACTGAGFRCFTAVGLVNSLEAEANHEAA